MTEEPLAYAFGPFRVEPAQRLVLVSEKPVRLGGRAYDMLVVLIERRHRTVSKQELMDLVWPGLIVEENNLQVQVAGLRKLLGHAAIATVPGRGYQFAIPVQVLGPDASAGPSGVAASTMAEPRAAMRVTNLPEHTPEIYGRSSDLLELQRLLDEHTLVTIAGAGGIGKTRLAQSAAQARIGTLADGVWWVELAPISDPALVPSAVGRALGVSFDGSTDETRAVLDALSGRAALVVLDNAEHVMDGVAAFVAAVRQRAPRVRLLVTSQEVLHAMDEHVFRLGPLSLPVGDEPAAASACGAVMLFEQRARAVDSRFSLNLANRDVVIDICRRLDGIPLAIELAAARMNVLGVEGLRSVLDERFRVLTGGSRIALRRHQTLRGAMEWSHGLLSPPEQAVFRRLGVFVGGFTLNAAQEVADDDTIDVWDVLEHLGALVDKSLVLSEGDAVPRYRMLETTRLFALERLIEAGEAARARRRHRAHFLARAEDMERHLVGDHPGRRIAGLDDERDNLLLALAWSDEDDERGRCGLRLVCALRSYWTSRGLLARGHEVTREMLARPSSQGRDGWRCLALLAAAQQRSWMGNNAEALGWAQDALGIAREIGEELRTCSALVLLAQIHQSMGDVQAARACVDEALVLGRGIGDSHELAKAVSTLAMLQAYAGEHDEGRQSQLEVLRLWRQLELPFGQAVALMNLAYNAISRRCPMEAKQRVAEALTLLPSIDSRYVGQNLVDVACVTAAATGAAPLALRLRAASLRQRAEIHMPLDEIDAAHATHLERARVSAGPEECAQAESVGRAMDHEQTLQEIRRWLTEFPSEDS